jgi:hypothetical protein
MLIAEGARGGLKSRVRHEVETNANIENRNYQTRKPRIQDILIIGKVSLWMIALSL